ncbi:MAG: universal stress protein [Erythrobacter tepidarius]
MEDPIIEQRRMEIVLAAIDASAYATSVCAYAGWAAKRLSLPVELLHVVQQQDPVTARRDLSGAIGLGVKSDLMEELVRLSEASSRAEIEKGRVILKAGAQLLRDAGIADVTTLHRHGGVVETIVEREDNARLLVMGKRGTDHEFTPGELGSIIERVVRASAKPVLVANRAFTEPQHVVFAYDASPAARRALERLAHSPLFAGLPVTIVMAEAEAEGAAKRALLDEAEAEFAADHQVTTLLDPGRAEQVIPQLVARKPNALLLMGAYGHSPLRQMFIGSTTTAMIRTVKAPVLLVR